MDHIYNLNSKKLPPKAIGQIWLVKELDLKVPSPFVQSFITSGSRLTQVSESGITECYPPSYLPISPNSVLENFRFALKHEPLDLGVIVAALKATDPKIISDWVKLEPTGVHSRRVWFFYETFTGRTLDLPSVKTGKYVEALNPKYQIVSERRNSARHRVINNLLGGSGLCITVRRTPRLVEQMHLHLSRDAIALAKKYDSEVLTRAVNYLYKKETRSSFAIEGLTPSTTKAERFVLALRQAADFQITDKNALVRLQNEIVDPRYAEIDWRTCQNFIGEFMNDYREHVHFICPKPEDVKNLMNCWIELSKELEQSELVDPIISAAIIAFSFVFIHPFEDGNGRIHRFLIHHVLSKKEFTPQGIVFPVSAAILRDRKNYDRILDSFSEVLMGFIDWRFTDEHKVIVNNPTADLYRYFDATKFAEYLYDRVHETVQKDLKEELEFVDHYDRALSAVLDIVDMPDQRASLFVRICLRNTGKVPSRKRKLFPELTDEEINAMETAIQDIF